MGTSLRQGNGVGKYRRAVQAVDAASLSIVPDKGSYLAGVETRISRYVQQVGPIAHAVAILVNLAMPLSPESFIGWSAMTNSSSTEVPPKHTSQHSLVRRSVKRQRAHHDSVRPLMPLPRVAKKPWRC
jgi:hypothetical protein